MGGQHEKMPRLGEQVGSRRQTRSTPCWDHPSQCGLSSHFAPGAVLQAFYVLTYNQCLLFLLSHFTYEKLGAQEDMVIFINHIAIQQKTQDFNSSRSLLLATQPSLNAQPRHTHTPIQKGSCCEYVKWPFRTLQNQLRSFPKYQEPTTTLRNSDALLPV